MGRIVGIDLGTTNSCVAVFENGTPTVIHNNEGARTTPSVVGMANDGTILVGARAQRQAITKPESTIMGVKRLIGRKVGGSEFTQWSNTISYEICRAENGDAWVRVRDQTYSPQEISAFILSEIKRVAENYLGEEVSHAVITVPAYFDDSQRQATIEAGYIASLNVAKIINEPTAAALGYSLGNNKSRNLAIFDLGGGTFDVTILRATDGVFEVLSSNGDTFLGGEDFDRAIFEYLVQEFRQTTGVDLGEDIGARARLKEVAESIKCELSSLESVEVNLPFICATDSGPLHLKHEGLSRPLFEDLTRDLVDGLEFPCNEALRDAGLEAEDVDQVLLVGGMTRVPSIQRKVTEIFQTKPAKGANPDEIVAIGAAMQAAIMDRQMSDVVLLDVTPHSLGVRVAGGEMSVVIPKNTAIPTSTEKMFSTTRDQQDFVLIDVYQGEGDHVGDNTYLGRFRLSGLPRKKAGEALLSVTFVIDGDGVANVSAREVETGVEASVHLKAASGLSKTELQKLRLRHQQLIAG